jgi:hypothetical protein
VTARRKRKTYDDNFRADTVLMLEAAGYPNQKGALTAVAKKVKAPPRTISRWFNKENNPPPDRLVKEKRGELVERLEDMAHMLLDAMGVDIGENGVDAVRAAVAMGITIDKWQLLKGEPTGIVKIVQMIQEGRVRPEAVRAKWPHLADDLFARAGVEIDAV